MRPKVYSVRTQMVQATEPNPSRQLGHIIPVRIVTFQPIVSNLFQKIYDEVHSVKIDLGNLSRRIWSSPKKIEVTWIHNCSTTLDTRTETPAGQSGWKCPIFSTLLLLSPPTQRNACSNNDHSS